jgi:serine/threonine protein kinase
MKSGRLEGEPLVVADGHDFHEAINQGRPLFSRYTSREATMLERLKENRAFGTTQATESFVSAAPVSARRQIWSVATGKYVDKTGAAYETSEEAPIMYLNIVMPRCDGTLEDWLKLRLSSYAAFSASQDTRLGRCAVARDLILQLLQALSDLHENGIAHRDLKPANVLLTRRELEEHPTMSERFPLLREPAFLLQLADFGSSKDVTDGSKSTPYVTTRWYRAPEIFFGSTQYSTAIDMWAVGSIVAQLFLVSPLFCALRSDGEQLMQHTTLLGLPSQSDLHAMNVPSGTMRSK